MKRTTTSILSMAMAAILIASCATKKEVFVEAPKDLDGTWRVSQVTRNASDITPYIDSAGFRLILQPDKTYSLQSVNIPFVVTTNGTWVADDPKFPYILSFTPKDSTTTIKANVSTPVSMGTRTLQVIFSSGCNANTYVYTFEKLQ